ncbi:class I SAM-dependent methyltransferase [Leucobacter sp. 1207-22]|uniref:class I SAM-dependent methyltransferase n=1 Tax=Leucobacter sp. 1207-22 TaxID=2604456 RepID=UPI0040637E0E
MHLSHADTNAYRSLAARVYEADKPVGRSFGDVEFYADLLSGTTGTIFEPAAGNGRVLIPLALRGLSVAGDEPSSDMRALCAQAAAAAGVEIPLGSGRFTDINVQDAYAAIIIPAGSLQLVTSPSEVRAAISGMYRALRPGGRLILDLDSLAGLYETAASARSWQDGDELLTLTEIVEQVDPMALTRTSQLRYELWQNGALVASELERFALRFWGPHEMATLLELCGFSDVSVHADYTLDVSPTAATEVVTLVATK